MFASFRWVVALTAALAVVFAVSGWAVEGIQWSRLPRELVLVALNTLPLLAVRRNPLAVVAVFSVTYPTWVALGHPIHELQSLPAIAAMYALAGWDRPLWLRALGLVMPVWMVTGGVLLWGGDVLDSPTALTLRSRGGVRVTFSANGHDLGFLARLPDVTAVTSHTGHVAVDGGPTAPVHVAAAPAGRGIVPHDYRTHHPTLEDAFLALTGRCLIEEVSP